MSILFVCRDKELKKTELSSKLESAFMCGLRLASDSELRTEFFNLWKESIGTKSVYNQLLYVVCSQNWESMHDHFWIKQCVQVCIFLKLSLSVNQVFVSNTLYDSQPSTHFLLIIVYLIIKVYKWQLIVVAQCNDS